MMIAIGTNRKSRIRPSRSRGPRGAEQREELPVLDLEVDPVDRDGGVELLS
jgi:hypothetical protein